VNPFNIISLCTPLISLSCRLWGNIFAGGLIISLWYYFTQNISSAVPYVGIIDIFGATSIVPIRGYFDVMCGVIQALVFTLLTIMYWNLAKGKE
jgi:F-type H+-transporting ATPase subunit a